MTAEHKTPYRYIQRHYGLTFLPGQRVRFKPYRRLGNVMRPQGDPQYVRVRLDGDKHGSDCHPQEVEIFNG